MGKKRKAGGRPAASNTDKEEPYRFDIEERFDDSEDEFQAGRDQILLDEAPEAKRRRKVAEDGMLWCPVLHAMLSAVTNSAAVQRKRSNYQTRRSWATSPSTRTKTWRMRTTGMRMQGMRPIMMTMI
jgi:hypothetical protein